MIQIKRDNLDELALKHCEGVKGLIHNNLKAAAADEKGDKNSEYYKFLYERIDTLLMGENDKLSQIVKDWEAFFPTDKKLKKEVEATVSEIFCKNGYDKFSAKKETKTYKYNAYELTKSLNVNVCPYCNRQNTQTLVYSQSYYTESKKIKKTKEVQALRPDLDHFMPKSIYPYLALSFYNFIPSCLPCNERLKGSKNFRFDNHLHPYTEGFGNQVKFELKIKSVDFFGIKYEGKETAKIVLNYENADKDFRKKAEKNAEVFELERLYNFHLDYVYELMNKAMIYNDDYLLSLSKQLGGSFKNEKDVALFISSNYVDEDELHLRPLSKLTKDMMEQFGL